MADDPFDYTRLVQRALLGVVRDALRLAASAGLQGEHHFYITFRTDAPGVELPPRLRAEYPQQMTIVLQHLFWELAADEEKFSVTLRFGGAPEHIEVPFAALISFLDPSTHFGLRFEADATEVAQPPRARSTTKASPVAARPALAPALKARRATTPTASKRAPRKRVTARVAPAAAPPPTSGPKVVDLAAFRRQSGDKDDDKGPA